VYFTCATASVNRAPFDLAEAESELVAGFHTEYSGLRWSVFFMAEYGTMFLVSGLAAILFFGGWHGPIPVTSILHDIVVNRMGFELGSWTPFWQYMANLLGCLNFVLKGVIGVTVMMWVRWTLPRLRIDQVITTCLKYCVPIAAACFVGAVLWQAWEIPFLNDIPGLAIDRGAVREHWVESISPAASEDEPAAVSRDSGGDAVDDGDVGVRGLKPTLQGADGEDVAARGLKPTLHRPSAEGGGG
jgi:NADH-quinone oxidoreductase subunit H